MAKTDITKPYKEEIKRLKDYINNKCVSIEDYNFLKRQLDSANKGRERMHNLVDKYAERIYGKPDIEKMKRTLENMNCKGLIELINVERNKDV